MTEMEMPGRMPRTRTPRVRRESMPGFKCQTRSTREFSEDAYKRAAEPKELAWVRGAGHVDLYDRVDLIPFDKLTSFFKQHLTA